MLHYNRTNAASERNKLMKKNKTLIKHCMPVLALLSTAVLLTACPKPDPAKEADEYGVTPTMEGAEVLDQLHSKMLETHKKYVLYSSFTQYEDTSNGKTAVDADATKGGVKGFYTGIQKSTYSGYTREHVWPCANSNGLWDHSVVDKSGYKGGGSDLYHVRAVLSDVNTRRGNSKFYEFKSTDTKYQFPSYPVPYTITVDQDADYASKFEPADTIKGDIARLIVYVYTHYAAIGDNSEVSAEVRSYLGALDFRQVFNSSYSLNDIYEILVRWNESDPVSADELLRNDTVEKIQGNRNPFVDHPEYIRRIWMSEE